MIDEKRGLTSAECEVADALIQAFNAYSALPMQHPDEMNDFTRGIHSLQALLAVRIARRCYPDGWPSYTDVSGYDKGQP